MNRQEAADILGLHVNATPDEVKARVRSLSVKYHPDKHSGASEDLKELAAEKFSKVREAGQIMLGLIEETSDVESFQEEVAQEADEMDSLLYEAEDHLNADRPAKAILVLRQVLSVDPSHVMANYYMGLAASHMQNWRMAAEYMHRVVTFVPDNENAWHTLALAEYNSGSYVGAIAATERAMSLSPEVNVEYIELMALIHIAKGDTLSADHWIHELSRYSPHNRLVQQRGRSYRVGSRYVGKSDAASVGAGAGCCICGILELIFDCF